MKLAGTAAASTPDPSTLSARDRIRLHVQRNLQQQQAAAALKQQSQSSAPQAPANRKRPLSEVTGPAQLVPKTAMAASDEWDETNTPPTSAPSVSPDNVLIHPNKRRVGVDDAAYHDNMDEARYREDDEDAEAPEDLSCHSPPHGMLAARIDGVLDDGPDLYAHPEPESRSGTQSPTGAGKDLGLCDSPPYENHQDENWVAGADAEAAPHHHEVSATSPGQCIEAVADDDWVAGMFGEGE